ncbi:hypothetical protein R6Z07F_004567 [Ovis aries]
MTKGCQHTRLSSGLRKFLTSQAGLLVAVPVTPSGVFASFRLSQNIGQFPLTAFKVVTSTSQQWHIPPKLPLPTNPRNTGTIESTPTSNSSE